MRCASASLLSARNRMAQPGQLSSLIALPILSAVLASKPVYRGGTETAALAVIDEKIRANTGAVLDKARRTGALPRSAALSPAIERVRRAMQTRRWDGVVA